MNTRTWVDFVVSGEHWYLNLELKDGRRLCLPVSKEDAQWLLDGGIERGKDI